MKIVLGFLFGLVATLAQGAEIVTQVKTIAPVAIPAAKEVRAMFEGLRPDALQLGLGEALLIGATTYETLPDKNTRVTVGWHTLTLTSGTAVQPLKAPLLSQFRTGDATLAPNSLLSARGDFDSLVDDFLALKEKLKKATPKDVVKQTNNNNTENTAAKNPADALQPSGSGSGFTPGSGASSFNNSNDKVKTDLITTQWQNCQPRIDRTANKVFAQARRLDVTESGRVMYTGDCEDHGSTVDVVKEYDKTCTPVVDVANRKVYHQFREFATLDGKTVDVSLCTADFNKFDPILADTNACGYRHDFIAGRSIQQEALYYNDTTGAILPVRGCGDSVNAFTHYATQNTCTPTIDTPNKQVFINVRTAFKDGGGAELYANDCRPDGNPAFPVSEEFCAPKYEHDFINNASYYSTRPYYVNGSGSVVYLAACSRSAQASFPHVKVTASCGVRNDDANMKTFFSEKKQIDTTLDGIIEIAPCTESVNAVTYAYTGPAFGAEFVLSTGDQIYTRKTVADMAGVSPTDQSFEIKPKTNTLFCSYHAGYAIYQAYISRPVFMTDVLNTVGVENTSDGNNNTITYAGPTGAGNLYDSTYRTFANNAGWSTRLWKEPKLSRYLRGDGSYFEKEIGARFWIQAGCRGAWQ